MARAILGAAMLVGLFSHAPTVRADSAEDITREATRAGVDPVDLEGALNSEHDAGRDVSACEYEFFNGEVEGCIGTALTVKPEPSPVSDVWDRVAQCESGGKWNTNTGNGFYGGLQFTLGTWQSYGGTGMPQLASRSQQIAVAERVLHGQGWGAWPFCSRRLGLR